MFRVFLMLVVLSVGCSKSASEKLAEKELEKRTALIQSCQECLDREDFFNLKRHLSDPMTQNDPDFMRFRVELGRFEGKKFER